MSLPASFNDTCAWDIKDNRVFDTFMKDKFVSDSVFREFKITVQDMNQPSTGDFNTQFDKFISDLYKKRYES